MAVDKRAFAALLVGTMVMLAGPATAQGDRPSDAQLKAAITNLNLMITAMRDKNAPPAVRDLMFGCLYEHPLGDISERVTKTFAARSLLKADDPEVRLSIIAQVCGAAVAQKAP